MRFFLLLTVLLNLILSTAAFSKEKTTKEIVLTNDNLVVLNDVVTDESVSKLIGEIKKLDASLQSGYPIYLFLYTPGGSIQAGIELMEFLKGVNRPVNTVTLFSASMGFQLVQSLGTRYILEHGILMSHKAAGGFSGEFGGETSQLDSRYGLWLRRLRAMDETTVARTEGKKTLKQYQSEYDNELWLNGAEAVANGYADEVVSVKCSESLSGERIEYIQYFGNTMQVVFDKCPLRTAPISVSMIVRTNKGTMSLNDFLAKGGVFQKVKTDAWSSNLEAQSELYSIEEGLTLVSAQKIISEFKNNDLTKKKNIIKMSFKGFVSE
jgi:ATP-dependent Clp protease protease subunit